MEEHRVQLVVALLPLSVRRVFPPPDVPAVTVALRTFHKALAEQVAEVCRRRMALTAMAERQRRPAPEPDDDVEGGLGPARFTPCARLQDLLVDPVGGGTPSPAAAAPRMRGQTRAQLAATRQDRQTATTEVHRWLQRLLGDGSLVRVGEDIPGVPTVALLLWWEAEVGHGFPGHSDLHARKKAFSRAIGEATETDTELGWLKSRRLHRALGPGLPRAHETWWNARVANVEADPYKAAWRAHVVSVLQEAADERAEGQDANAQRRIRRRTEREASPPVAAAAREPDPAPLVPPPRGLKRPRAGSPPRRPPPAARSAPAAHAAPEACDPDLGAIPGDDPPRQRRGTHGRATDGAPT
jgi:hypothetical protein